MEFPWTGRRPTVFTAGLLPDELPKEKHKTMEKREGIYWRAGMKSVTSVCIRAVSMAKSDSS